MSVLQEVCMLSESSAVSKCKECVRMLVCRGASARELSAGLGEIVCGSPGGWLVWSGVQGALLEVRSEG